MLFSNNSIQSKYLTFSLLLQVSKKVVALAPPNTYTQLLTCTPSTFFLKRKHHYAKTKKECNLKLPYISTIIPNS